MYNILLLNGTYIYGFKEGATQEEIDVMGPHEYVLVDEIPQELWDYKGIAVWDSEAEKVVIQPITPSREEIVATKLARLEQENTQLQQRLLATEGAILFLMDLA